MGAANQTRARFGPDPFQDSGKIPGEGPDNQRFRWIFCQLNRSRGPNLELEELRAIFRMVLRFGSPEELEALASAQLEADDPTSIILGLETLQRVRAGAEARPDDDIQALGRRRTILRAYRCQPAALVGAIRICPALLRGDLLLLCVENRARDLLDCVVSHLERTDTWSEFSARILLQEAHAFQALADDRKHALESSLAMALDQWTSHRCRDVLLASTIVLADLGCDHAVSSPLARVLNNASGDGVRALRTLVADARELLVRACLPRLLAMEALQPAALSALESTRPVILETALEHGAHLLHDPHRAKLVASSRVAPRLAGRIMRGPVLTEAVLRAAPRILSGGLSDDVTLAHRLAAIALAGDPLAGTLATGALRKLPESPSRRSALADIARGGMHAVAPLATCDTELLSPVQAQRSLAYFERALETRPPWWCAACSLAHLEHRQDALMAILRRTLESASSPALEGALEVISRRLLAPHFERELVALVARDPLQIPVPTGALVVRMLAHGPTGRSAQAIIRALASTEVQLQAAALEAAANSGASDAVRAGTRIVDEQLLERLAHAADARVRRSAFLALRSRSVKRFDRVVSHLLEDESEEHRLTAIEAARYSENADLRSQVLRLMERNRSPEVTTQGSALLRFLHVRQHPSVASHLERVP